MHNLKSLVTTAMLWDFLRLFSQQGVGFIISIFLARILSPEEFGLVGMALVFIVIFQVFADFGFASALIQDQESTSLTYSSIFYLNVCAGIILFGLFQLSAPYVAIFYNNSTIEILIRLLSINFILSSLNIVQRTLLRKALNFKLLAQRGLLAQFLGGIVGIIAALKGHGVFALVYQNLSAALLSSIFFWTVTKWYPRMEFSIGEVKKLFDFSFYVFLARILNQFVSRLDIFIIGKFYTPATLGFYTRAQSMESLVTKYSSSSISNIFFPVLSKIKDDKAQFNRVYFKLLNIISFLAFLLIGLLLILGKDIIIILFGPKWEPSVFIFQILILKAFTFPISSLIVSVFLAKGNSKKNFWYGNIRKIITLSIVPFAFFVAF